MAITVTQIVADASSGGVVEVHTNTISASIAAGDDIIVCIAQAAAFGFANSSVTDSQGHTYTWDTTSTISGAMRIGVWSARCTTPMTSAVDTITFTVGGSHLADVTMYAIKASGMGTAPDVDVSAGLDGTSTSPSSGTTATTTAADELVVCQHGYTGAPTYTAPAGFTQTASTQLLIGTTLGHSVSHKIVSTVGTQVGVGTLSSSQDWGGDIVTYKGLPAVVEITPPAASAPSTGPTPAPTVGISSPVAGSVAL